MKARMILLSAAMLLFTVGTTLAFTAPVADYDYTSELGADPTDQGWAYNKNISNLFLGGYDASIYTGQSGWRVVDGTSTGYAWYGDTLTAEETTAMKGSFTATWTFKLDSDALKTDGSGGVTGYYLPPNEGRQNDNALWIETDEYMYLLVATADASGNLAINDGTATHVLTVEGGNIGYDTQYTVSVVYDGIDAVLSYGGNDFTLTDYGTMGGNRIIFGAFSGAGQGSVVYDAISVDAVVPEPATLVLLGLGSVLLRRYRS